MLYYVPELNLQQALSFEKSLQEIVPTDDFIFDFSRMSNFDPLPMLLTWSIIRRYRNQYPQISFSVDGINTIGKSYAGTMGFFKYISPSLEIGKAPGEEYGSSNYIPITLITTDDLQRDQYMQGNYVALGDIIENEVGRLARIVDRGNTELHTIIDPYPFINNCDFRKFI